MLQHVWERASQARYLTSLVIATDDERIRTAAEQFSAKVMMTRADHLSGTDRVAEAASASYASIVVNIQGDEPMIDPSAIDAAILGILDDPDIPMATLKTRIFRAADLDDPNVVKVVTDAAGNALYFSRCAIPFVRDAEARTGPARPPYAETNSHSAAAPGGVHPERVVRANSVDARAAHFKHLGLYVYQRDFLLGYPDLTVGPLERAERLEQLRALENGFKIRVVETDYDSLGVDTPEDWERISRLFEKTAV